jgi:hypothetical protein
VTLDLIMRFSAGNPRGLKQIRAAGPLFARSAVQDHPGKE